MSDSDFAGNEIFRKKLLAYVKATEDAKEFDYSGDSLWEAAGQASYTMANGQPLSIDYMFCYSYPGCSCYIAKESVVYIFEKDSEAAAFMAGLRRLSFPGADVKLQRCFPRLKMELALQGSGKALVFTRRPGFYPAELFSPWPSEHLAWVISRMENLCCAFEYSEIRYGDISATSVFINPITHEGAIFGDWRRVTEKRGNTDLEDLRKTAISLAVNTREPREMYDFLNSRPEATAFDDFARWDTVIEKGFGGHKFVQMQNK